MPEDTVPSIEVPKPKRKYARRKKAQKRVAKLTAAPITPSATMPAPAPPRPRHGAPKAMEEVDRQLAAAIAQKPAYHEQLANLYAQTTLTQQRLDRLTQQIQELVNLQRQLDGEAPATITGPVTELNPRVAAMIPGAQMFGAVPQGVGSIPAKQPHPSNGNVAEQAKGVGWE